MKKYSEKIMAAIFAIAASVSVISVVLICYFLFSNGIGAIIDIGFTNFIFGKEWRPGNDIYGIFPMIIGTFYITGGALVIGIPIGLLMAVFLSRYCPKKIYGFVNSLVELLAGIPSIIYGFFGMVVLVPFVKNNFAGNGNSIFTAAILLGIMILPTIISVSKAALMAVPESYYEGAVALGATKEISIFKVVIPAAKSGITAAIALGIGRAMGETMAVMMIAGNQPRIPDSVFEGVRTLTTNIVLEMGYATDLHREALIATGVVLFVLILIINLFVSFFKRKRGNS